MFREVSKEKEASYIELRGARGAKPRKGLSKSLRDVAEPAERRIHPCLTPKEKVT